MTPLPHIAYVFTTLKWTLLYIGRVVCAAKEKILFTVYPFNIL